VRLAVALLLGAALSIQFGAAFAVTLFDDLGPGGTVFLRLGFAAIILLAVWRPRVRGRSRADLGVAIGLGLMLGGMNWSFYEAVDRIPLGPAVTLEFVGPMGVAIAGSRRPLDVLWVALAATGVVVLADPFGAGGLDAGGAALALLAGGFWAAYILLAARTGRVWTAGSGLAFGMGFGALVAAPAGVAQGGGSLLEPELLLAGLGVALASSVIPYSLEMESLRRIPESVFGVMMSLEPAVATAAGFLVLDQALSAADLLAITLVVVASAGAAAGARMPQPPPDGTGVPIAAAAVRNRSG
jgi:inner membrane transporter RhtA